MTESVEKKETDFISREQLDEEIEKAKEKIENTFHEYRDFAFKGDLLKLASAFILAGVVNEFVTTITAGVLMPLINYVVLHSIGNWRTAAWTPVAGMTFEIGKTINSGLNLFLITLLLFFLIKWLGRLDKPSLPVTPSKRKRKKKPT